MGPIFFEAVPKLSHSGSCLYAGFLGYIPFSLGKFTKESHRRNSGIYLIPRFGVARDDVMDDKYWKTTGGRNATRRVDEAGYVQRSPAADIRHGDSHGSGIDAMAGSPILK
jgi:hypothetical protein